ncbi:MAG TPA: sugar-binding transcriptional regulator [Firmicutes bacterium]|nr:sugar-binding transcriptional regulator [Bacillota bacterium]
MTDPNQRHLMTRVASMYYEEEMTQQEIADLMGVSRIRIVRLLQGAREQGIVTVSIKSEFKENVDIARRLKNALGLREVIVVSAPYKPENLLDTLGKAAGEYAVSKLKPNRVIGIAAGRTMKAMVDNMPERKIKGLVVCNIVGGLSAFGDQGAQELAFRMASRLGGVSHILNIPFRVDNYHIKEILLMDSSIKAAVDVAKRADMILLSVGSLNGQTVSEVYSNEQVYPPNVHQQLKEEQAVGEMIGRFFDIEGRRVLPELSEHLLGLDIDHFKENRLVVVVAGGEEKILPIIGAANGGYFNSLVTDDETAKAILDRCK